MSHYEDVIRIGCVDSAEKGVGVIHSNSSSNSSNSMDVADGGDSTLNREGSSNSDVREAMAIVLCRPLKELFAAAIIAELKANGKIVRYAGTKTQFHISTYL